MHGGELPRDNAAKVQGAASVEPEPPGLAHLQRLLCQLLPKGLKHGLRECCKNKTAGLSWGKISFVLFLVGCNPKVGLGSSTAVLEPCGLRSQLPVTRVKRGHVSTCPFEF